MIPTMKCRVALAAVLVSLACRQQELDEIRTTSAGETNVSPSADSASARGHAMVRIVHAGQTDGDVAMRISPDILFNDVKPESVTDYREVPATMTRFMVRAAGRADTATIAQDDAMLGAGDRYTVILVASDMSRSALRVLRDQAIPDSGKARLRIVHAAPGAPMIGVRVERSQDMLFSGLTFGSAAEYKDFAPGVRDLEFTTNDGQTVLLRVLGVDFRRGTSMTVVLRGASALTAFAFTDAIMPPMWQR